MAEATEHNERIKLLEELKRKLLKPKFLAVDDDTAFLELMSEVFGKGHDVELHCVESGEQALQLLTSGYKPDKIIIDLRMRGMDGIDLFREIKKHYPDAKVYFLTGASEDDRLKRIPEIGWATIIPKPSTLEQFLNIKGALVNG